MITRIRLRAAGALATVVCISAACASAGGAGGSGGGDPSPYIATCPLAAGTRGYPLAVTSAAGESMDAQWLDAVARAAGYRWAVPSRRRGDHARWRMVTNRVLPPEPRWADDWTPRAQHRAELLVTLHRDGRTSGVEVSRPSGDRLFDESLATIFDAPLPASPSLPSLPIGAPDSARLRFTFGEEPEGRAGLIRFAAQQTPLGMGPTPIRVPLVVGPIRARSEAEARAAAASAASRRRAVLKYDVDETGRMVPGSFEQLDGDVELGSAFRTALSGNSFTSAQSNCRPIALTVVQNVGR